MKIIRIALQVASLLHIGMRPRHVSKHAPAASPLVRLEAFLNCCAYIPQLKIEVLKCNEYREKKGFSLLEVLAGISLGGSLLLGGFAMLTSSMRVCLDNYGVEQLHETGREYLYLALKKDFESALSAYCTKGLIERDGKPLRDLFITPLLGSNLSKLGSSTAFFENLKAIPSYSINNKVATKVCHSLVLLGFAGEIKALYEIISEEVPTGLLHEVIRFAPMGESFLSKTDSICIHARGKYNFKTPDQVIPRVEERKGYFLVLFPTSYGASRLSSVSERPSSLQEPSISRSVVFRLPYFNYKLNDEQQ